jgi:hypothetical protein
MPLVAVALFGSRAHPHDKDVNEEVSEVVLCTFAVISFLFFQVYQVQ